jgi:hypothetical protein
VGDFVRKARKLLKGRILGLELTSLSMFMAFLSLLASDQSFVTASIKFYPQQDVKSPNEP